MSFDAPVALLGLLAIPVLVALLVVGERRRRQQGARFGTPALVALSTSRSRRRFVPFVLAIVALTTLIVGVARPRATLTVPRREATVILAIDTSRSMSATDVRPSRLAAALSAARSFFDTAPSGYAVGIVTFSTRASLILPPTTDRDAARRALDQIRLSSGTALGDAIGRSVAVARPGRAARQSAGRCRQRCCCCPTERRRPEAGPARGGGAGEEGRCAGQHRRRSGRATPSSWCRSRTGSRSR